MCILKCIFLLLLVIGCGSHIDVESLSKRSTQSENSNLDIGNVTIVSTSIIGNGEVSIEWIPESDVDGYQIIAKKGSPPNSCADGDITSVSSGSTNNAVVDNLDMGDNYYFIVCPLLGSEALYFDNNAASSQSLDISIDLSFVYATNGQAWNEYVLNDGADEFSALDNPCDSNLERYFQCIHGGERLKFEVQGINSCELYSAKDDLDAFNWSCKEEDEKLVFYSRLKKSKGLRHLVNSSSWKENFVSLKYQNNTIISTNASAWWPNNVIALPDNTGSGLSVLTNSGSYGDIYTVSSNSSTDGVNLNSDKMAIVIFDGAELTFDLNTNNVDGSTGDEQMSNDISSTISIGGQNYIWVEGKIKGDLAKTNQDYGIFLAYSKFSHIRHTETSMFKDGVKLRGASSNFIYDLKSYLNREEGIEISNDSSMNVFKNLNLTENEQYGVGLDSGSGDNYFITVKVTGNVLGGFYNLQTPGNTFVQILAFSNADDGFKVENLSTPFTAAHISAVNNGDNGYQIFINDQSTSVGILAVNNGGMGFEHRVGNSGRVYNVASYSNRESGISVISSTSLSFHNSIKIGSNIDSECSISTSSSSDAGLNSDCSAAGASDHTVFPLDLSNSFGKKINTDDSVNLTDTSGQASYTRSLNFTDFESFFRSWGKNGDSDDFPDINHIGKCVITETCAIWDYRLLVSDNELLNKSNGTNNLNDEFITNEDCPSSANGNNTITDNQSSPNTFLLNAIEIIDDFAGDEDGLCESNERCIFVKNVGAYQGEGDYKTGGTCNFIDGTVSNVSLYAFPDNGI